MARGPDSGRGKTPAGKARGGEKRGMPGRPGADAGMRGGKPGPARATAAKSGAKPKAGAPKSGAAEGDPRADRRKAGPGAKPARPATKTPPKPTRKAPLSDTPERVAKVIARAGRASRREAERLIEEGRVSVNGAVIDRAALNVGPGDRVAVDGVALDAPEAARLWLYHKPAGLVTTTRDEQGRPTIYDDLPEDLPRVMSVGRLDINSEGLILLTNDGGLKRRMELPSTGWLRRYRVRVNGRPTDATLAPLREGITVDGVSYQPMIVSLDRQQGANAWLTVGLREGKNREVRRAMQDIGLVVNRLIRVSYGPFQLGTMKPGEVQEVRGRVLRDQLGLPDDGADDSGDAGSGKAAPRRRVRRAGGGPARSRS